MIDLFNKIIALILAVLMPLGAKIGFSKYYDSYRTVFPQGGVETAGGELFYDFAYSTEKVKPTDNLGQDRDFAISMAKNEDEGCQLTVSSDTEGKTVLLRVSPAKNAGILSDGRRARGRFLLRFSRSTHSVRRRGRHAGEKPFADLLYRVSRRR